MSSARHGNQPDPRSAARIIYRVEKLAKTYGTGAATVHALRGVDVAIEEGRLSVLLGPSGSGKSTFLNMLGGLDRASSGHAWFHDADLTRAGDTELTEPGTSRRSSAAASSSASPSPGQSRNGPTCCCATSRPARSTA